MSKSKVIHAVFNENNGIPDANLCSRAAQTAPGRLLRRRHAEICTGIDV
jgi:hypothetical protein